MKWLKEIEARLKAATPGPWVYDSYSRIFAEHGNVAKVPTVAGDTATKQGAEDAEFIAHSPADVARLIEALRIATEALSSYADYGMSGAHAEQALDRIEKIGKGT